MNNSTTCLLPDGRNLAYAEYGDPSGVPLLFFHGMPGSRHQISPDMAGAASKTRIRIILPERPGYGLSDPVPEGQAHDGAQDISVLMNHLGIERCGIIGYSLGGLHALTCAHRLAERVSSVALVGGISPNLFSPDVLAALSPIVVPMYTLARDNPIELKALVGQFTQAPDQFFATLGETLAPVDKPLFAQPEITARWRADVIESLRNEGAGMVRDLRFGISDWDTPIETIQVPVNLWHGEEDANAPLAMAKYLAAKLPRCTTRFLPDEGHLCLYANWQAVLGSFV